MKDLQQPLTWHLDADESAIYRNGTRMLVIAHGTNNSEWRAALRAGAEIVERLNAAPQPAENLGTADVWHEGSRSFYRAALLHRLTPEEALGDVTEVAPQPSPLKLSSDGAAAVNPDTFWEPITPENMPLTGKRYLLINRNAGMTQVAPFKNDGWYTHFAGMPKFKD